MIQELQRRAIKRFEAIVRILKLQYEFKIVATNNNHRHWWLIKMSNSNIQEYIINVTLVDAHLYMSVELLKNVSGAYDNLTTFYRMLSVLNDRIAALSIAEQSNGKIIISSILRLTIFLELDKERVVSEIMTSIKTIDKFMESNFPDLLLHTGQLQLSVNSIPQLKP